MFMYDKLKNETCHIFEILSSVKERISDTDKIERTNGSRFMRFGKRVSASKRSTPGVGSVRCNKQFDGHYVCIVRRVDTTDNLLRCHHKGRTFLNFSSNMYKKDIKQDSLNHILHKFIHSIIVLKQTTNTNQSPQPATKLLPIQRL